MLRQSSTDCQIIYRTFGIHHSSLPSCEELKGNIEDHSTVLSVIYASEGVMQLDKRN